MSAPNPERPPADSAPVGFLTLPIELRNNIYKQLLTLPHPLYLFQDPGSPIETFAPEKPNRWLALLYANRQISLEARMVLYGVNRLILQESGVESTRRTGPGTLLESFLRCIGGNAGYLTRLWIDFPAMVGDVSERVVEGEGEGEGCSSSSTTRRLELREHNLRGLALLRGCARLKMLEMVVSGQNARLLVKGETGKGRGEGEEQIETEGVREVLEEINARLGGVPSLDRIVVRVYGGSLVGEVREVLEGIGWVVAER